MRIQYTGTTLIAILNGYNVELHSNYCWTIRFSNIDRVHSPVFSLGVTLVVCTVHTMIQPFELAQA